MEFKVNQNNSAFAGEAAAASDVVEYGDSFEELAEAQLFEELANGDERESGDGAESGESGGGADSGSSGGNGGQPGNGSSGGQQRVLDYWSAQKEAEIEGIDALAESESSGIRARDDDKGVLTSASIPALNLTAEEEAELARAAESFDALAFLQDDDDEAADWYDDDSTDVSADLAEADLADSVEEASAASAQAHEDRLDAKEANYESQQADWVDGQSAYEDRIEGDSAGEIAFGGVVNPTRDGDSQHRRSRGHVELTPDLLDSSAADYDAEAAKRDSASRVDANDKRPTLPDTAQLKAAEREDLEADASRFETITSDQRGEESRAEARELRFESIAENAAQDAMAESMGNDVVGQAVERAEQIGEGDVPIELLQGAEGQNAMAAPGGDTGQGRSRGEYVMVEEEGVTAAEAAKKKGINPGDRQQSGQQASEATEQAELLAAQQDNLAEKAAASEEAVSLMQVEEMLEHYLAQREQQRLEQQRQELLDMLQQFQNRLNGLTQMAGHQGFMGAFMLMGFGAGGFALSPTVDRRGLMLEKAKENLKGAGGKGDSKKPKDGTVVNPEVTEQLEDDMIFKTRSPEDELSLSHDDLMSARKEAFRERFGQWLAVREEELGDEDDQMFIAHLLQNYDQFTLNTHAELAYLHPLWLSAMELMLPQTILDQCENALDMKLPALRGQLARYVQKTPVLSQNVKGDLTFDDAFATVIAGVSEQILRDNAAQHMATSQADAFAIVAQQMELPVVVVAFDGNAYSLLTPSPNTDQLWCPLQVWDIDWNEQRNLILMEGDRFRFLRRQF